MSSPQSLVGAANSEAALESIDFASAPLIPNFAQRMPRSDAKFGIGALDARDQSNEMPMRIAPAIALLSALLLCASPSKAQEKGPAFAIVDVPSVAGLRL